MCGVLMVCGVWVCMNVLFGFIGVLLLLLFGGIVEDCGVRTLVFVY